MNRVLPEVIELFGDLDRVVEFLVGVLFSLRRDGLILRPVELLAVNDVLNDRLVLARQVFLQPLNQRLLR